MDASPVAEAPPAARAGGGPFARRASAGRWWPVLLVAAITAVGVVLRLVVAHDSFYADEYSTYWIVTAHDFPGVLSTVHSNAEITPPLYFALAWFTAKIGHAPELVRLPSLIAGVVTMPVVYALGLRTVGRTAALVATAFTALAPFMVYYSAEARGYALLMALVVGSTLAMLAAVDTGRRRWWIAYAVCSCAAAYTHYTGFFVLLAQFGWVVWAHPEARRPALVANVAAVVGFLPWISGLHNDLTSPTSQILSALSPFNLASIRSIVEHWSVGYPYAGLSLQDLPGIPALIVLALALGLAGVGLGLAIRSGRARPRLDRRVALVLLLAAAAPIGEMAVSAVSTNLFGVRNLAPSWPFLALLFAALLVAAGPRLRVVAVALVLAVFALSAVKMLESRYGRPDYSAAAAFVAAQARPGDVVIDETAVLSPGPLSPLDVTLRRPPLLIRAASPAERDHPFGFADPIVPVQPAIDRAVAVARGRKIFQVLNRFPPSGILRQRRHLAEDGRFPAPYRRVATRVYPSRGFLNPAEVRVYAAR